MLEGLLGYETQGTFVLLERYQWPDSWAGMIDPVCPRLFALYGHPLVGTCWEQVYTDIAVSKRGFLPIPCWEWLFYNPELQSVQRIYVDDFKNVGPCDSVYNTWQMFRTYLALENLALR